MKYKVGDKVKIKSLDWYNANKNSDGKINTEILFVSPMSKYCGEEANIIDIIDDTYLLDIDNKFFSWSEDMFDENFEDMETKKIIIPDGWKVEKVEGNKVILKESKKELPKTWKECISKLNCGEYISNYSHVIDSILPLPQDIYRNVVPIGLGKPLLSLCQLLVCREAYRNGWKPDWSKCNYKYCIKPCVDDIVTETSIMIPRVLSFQSAEIRDKFLENFKDLIEVAKKLI